MAALLNMPSLRMAALLIGAWVVAVAATSFPASVDLNLVFPRNATYDANTLLPMVFAFSNPALLTSLQVWLTYILYNANNQSEAWFDILVEPTNPFFDTNNTTYLAVSPIPEPFGRAGTWLLKWTLETSNCSTTDAGILEPILFQDLGIGYSDGSVSGWVTFSTTTGSDGAQPDVAAAAANTSCGNAGSGPIIYQVASTLNVSAVKNSFPDNFYGDTCAVLVGGVASPSPSPSPTVPLSCAVSLDADAIASISAAATKTACGELHPVVSCPPPTPSSAANGLRPMALSFLSFSPAVGCAAGTALVIAVVRGLF